MRFVGRDRYTGDLTDLLPLKEGEEMSDLEQNIREFYEDRLDAANRED
jgi:hypothetical protein